MTTTTALDDQWWLSSRSAAVPADLGPMLADGLATDVPATSHTVLLDHGLVPDPYLDDGEAALRWRHDVDWRLTRELTVPASGEAERWDLVFDGLDTVAEVSLGGRRLGGSVNMHRSLRLDVTDAADGRSRTLAVDLRSATDYAHEIRDRVGPRPSAYPDSPLNYVRKMACSFGWDWGRAGARGRPPVGGAAGPAGGGRGAR